MAELRNSQRVNYKATYVQMNPAAKQGESLLRAIEKTSFIHSLRITKDELTVLKEKASSADVKKAIPAIVQLVNDGTKTATLNNAPNFAGIDASTLLDIARSVIDLRAAKADEIKGRLARVVDSYRQYLGAMPPSGKEDLLKISETPPGGTAKSTITELATTSSGIAIRKTIYPSASKPRSGRGKIATFGARTIVGMDTSGPNPSSLMLASIKGRTGQMRISPRDAFAWAEKQHPELFGSLLDSIRPYTLMGDKEMEIYGKSAAMANLFYQPQQGPFYEYPWKGATRGFETRMHVLARTPWRLGNI